MGKKILVAVDDSENAMRAVKFIAESFKPEHKITLFSVLLDTHAICDMNSPSLTPYFLAQKDSFCSLEDQKKSLINEALEKAKGLLLQAGFQEKDIVIKVETQKKRVDRGIIDESNSGYDTIVLGRKGLSCIKEFFLGSVSQKVLQSVKDASVLLIY
ncbi:MAG: universal stress protein [Deltaproteobacteria bacterium]|nr:universal stress protein [Deltaproteobacteria bacterium]